MTILAWVFMLGSWSVILGCTIYCFAKLMTAKKLEMDDEPNTE